MRFIEADHRIVRQDAKGNSYEYSDSDSRPNGEGWQRVDQALHPRATKYLWFRPVSFMRKELKGPMGRKPLVMLPENQIAVGTGLWPKIAVGLENELNAMRNQLRKDFEAFKNPFVAGDKIKVKGREGKAYYVNKADPDKKEMMATNPNDPKDIVRVPFADAVRDDIQDIPWDIGDRVMIAAGVLGEEPHDGIFSGYDAQKNKVRVTINNEDHFVYPESIQAVITDEGAALRKSEEFIKKNPRVGKEPHERLVVESLLRATREGRGTVSTKEVMEDIEAVHGSRLSVDQVRGVMKSLSGGTGYSESLQYNPFSDLLDISRGNLPLRMLANHAEIKSKHRMFGWKNQVDPEKEIFASRGADVLFPQDDKTMASGKVVRTEGNKVVVKNPRDNTEKTFYMAEVKDTKGRSLIPDPLDPDAFGEIHKSPFWLLRDREWCRDYKRGDYVRFARNMEDPAGKSVREEFGTVVDILTNGHVLVETPNGKRFSASPRQLKKNHRFENLQQLTDRVNFNPEEMYGTASIIGDSLRVGVGAAHKGGLINLTFNTGTDYKKAESTYFDAIEDIAATNNQTMAVMPMDDSDPDRAKKTIVPNRQILDVLRKLYPGARTVAVVREMKVVPGSPPKSPGGEFDRSQMDKAARDIKMRRAGAPGKFKKQYDMDPRNVAGREDPNEQEVYKPQDYYVMNDQGEMEAVKPSSIYKQEKNKSWFGWANPWGDKTAGSDIKHYTVSDLDWMRANSPVTLKLVVNPDPKQVKGPIHSIPKLLRRFSDIKQEETGWSLWNDPTKPKFADDVNWDNAAKIHVDGENVYLSVGKELSKYQSATMGNMTLDALLNMPLTDKYSFWEKRGFTGEKLDRMVALSSLMVSDRTHKRYSAKLRYYNEVHELLKQFYGKDYDRLAYEDVDGAYVYSASNKKLTNAYQQFLKMDQDRRGQNLDEVPKDLTQGFMMSLMDGEERAYQRQTINWLLERPAALLANDQGTGKSATALAAIMGRINTGKARKILIGAPANLVTDSWPREISKFCRDDKEFKKNVQRYLTDWQKKHGKRPTDIARAEAEEFAYKQTPISVDYSLLTPGKIESFADKIYNAKSPVIGVASYEMLHKYSAELARLGFDMMLLDEAQNIKTGETTKRAGAKRTATIKDAFSNVPLKIAMTGTPIENSPLDLHSIVSWLNPHLFGTAENFMQDFMEMDFVQTPEGKKPVNIMVKRAGELAERMREVFKRTSKDWIREQETMKIQAMNPDRKIDEATEYGIMAPRYKYPNVALNPDGSVNWEAENVSDPFAKPVNVDDPKYADYRALVDRATKKFMGEYLQSKAMSRGGQRHTAATNALTRMQQVLNDPSLIADKPGFELDADFKKAVANPKYDRLMDILKHHEQKPLTIAQLAEKQPELVADILKKKKLPTNKPLTKELIHSPLDPKHSNETGRKLALATRGKVIIFAQYAETLDWLRKQMEKSGYGHRLMTYSGKATMKKLNPGETSGKQRSAGQMRQDVLKLFSSDPTRDILLANDAAQTGLNLPEANLVINYDVNWNPRAMDQRIDRAHRFGTQPRPVTAYNIVTKKSVEEKKVRSHAFKDMLFKTIIKDTERQQKSAEERAQNMPRFNANQAALLGDDQSAVIEDLMKEQNTNFDELINMTSQSYQRSPSIKRLRGDNKDKKVGLINRMFSGGWF